MSAWTKKWLVVIYYTMTVLANKEKEIIGKVITGSKYSGGTGQFWAPPNYPQSIYKRDATSHIFILENVAVEGSVEVSVDEFYLHPGSWITVRNSKYGGYIGRFIGRYDLAHLPPPVIFTDTCCMRIEFQTGCCTPADARYTGFKATYKFVRAAPGKGRRKACEDNTIYKQLCNGECIPDAYDCPCPLYGESKCDNGMCIPDSLVCNGEDDCGDGSEEKLCKYDGSRLPHRGQGKMFSFAVVMSTVLSGLGFSVFVIIVIYIFEKVRAFSKKRQRKKLFKTLKGPLTYGKLWPYRDVGMREQTTLPVTPSYTEQELHACPCDRDKAPSEVVCHQESRDNRSNSLIRDSHPA